jgi:peptidyl-prolyl cis-trans isomerase A (cyclophilin A)
MPSPFRCTAALCLLACGSGPTTAPAVPTAAAPSASAPLTAPTTLASAAPPPAPVHHDRAALDPSLATDRAPEVFRAHFATTQGDFVVEVHRSWAPNGADRFYNLVKMGVYDDTRFFRAIDGFMVQFGIPGDPQVAAPWRLANIQDDPVTQSNERSFVTFAQTMAANSRSIQVFINTRDNYPLDRSRFAPFGQVVEGMTVVDALYVGYGEGAPEGNGPDQSRIQREGNAYLDKDFPMLDRILRTELLRTSPTAPR